MSDNTLKKSLLGFKKRDVINLIEKLQSENLALKTELENKSTPGEDYKEKYENLLSDYESLKAELDSLKSAENNKINSDEAVDSSNAVIRDAMKYGDSIVSAAKENAENILTGAINAVTAASKEINDANVRVSTARANLDYSLNSMENGTQILLEKLSKQISDLKEGM